MDWLLSPPRNFITPESLHHFHCFSWDHNTKWCITAIGATKLDFCFSLIQTPVGYRAFDEGILKLKQGTGHDHCVIQRYIVGTVASSVPWKFLVVLHTLLVSQKVPIVRGWPIQSDLREVLMKRRNVRRED